MPQRTATTAPVSIPDAKTIEELKNGLQVIINRLGAQVNSHDHRFVTTVDAQNHPLTNLPQPVTPKDAANKDYVDKALAEVKSTILNTLNRRYRPFLNNGGTGGLKTFTFVDQVGSGSASTTIVIGTSTGTLFYNIGTATFSNGDITAVTP